MEIKHFKHKLIESFWGNITLAILNLLFPLIITKIYGVSLFGSYTYGITIVSMALFGANLGMDVGLLYFIPKTGKKYVSSVFLINILTSGLAICLLLMFASKDVYPYLGLVWLLSAEQLFFSIFRARQHIKDFFLIKSLFGIFLIILLSYILFLFNGAIEQNIIIATYVGILTSILIYTHKCKDMFGTLSMKSEFISYSVTIILGGVMSILIMYIDIIMIEAIMTKTDVALYKVGSDLSLFPSIFLRIVNTIFPPIISKLYHDGNLKKVKELYEKTTRYLFLVSGITILLIFIFAKPILTLYGTEYLNAHMVLIYRGIGQLINASVGSVWYIVLMTGHPKIRFIAILIAAVMNIILNYILIPTMGIDGAALASMVSTIFINILGFFVVKKILHSKVYYII